MINYFSQSLTQDIPFANCSITKRILSVVYSQTMMQGIFIHLHGLHYPTGSSSCGEKDATCHAAPCGTATQHIIWCEHSRAYSMSSDPVWTHTVPVKFVRSIWRPVPVLHNPNPAVISSRPRGSLHPWRALHRHVFAWIYLWRMLVIRFHTFTMHIANLSLSVAVIIIF